MFLDYGHNFEGDNLSDKTVNNYYFGFLTIFGKIKI